MADEIENTAIDELIQRTHDKQTRVGRTEVNLRPRAITTMPLPMEPLRRRPQATPPIPTRRSSVPLVRALVTTELVPPLPVYVPAPNIGDPAEADATVPVEQYDFTELVDRHRVNLGPTPANKSSPRRTLLLALLPAVGIGALAAVFIGGYVMFDAEPGAPKHVVATPPAAAVAAPAAKADAPAPPVVVAPTELALTHEPTETPKVPSLVVPPPPDDAPAPIAEAPKPRTSVYVTSNKPVQIFVDGKSANATAPRKLYLSPGPHKITLWDTASGKTESIKLELSAGKVTPLDKRF
jgi:hypothetical protein